MNQKRRQQLSDVVDKLRHAESELDRIRDEEQESLDAMPENFQTTDKYLSMENAVECLEDAIGYVQEAADSVNDAIN